MADTVALSRRSQRTARIRRRATAAGLGVLLGAAILVGVTTPLPGESTTTSVAPSVSPTPADRRLTQSAPAAPAPRRIRTRQS